MQKQSYPVASFSFWKSYLVQCRPYLLFVSGIAGIAGIAIAGIVPITSGFFWMAFVPFFMGYGLGQALTDTWQLDTDRISAPYRPMSQGFITPLTVRWISLIGLTICAVFLIFLNFWNAIFGLLTIAGLATYTLIKRRYWFAGPFYNAAIVALLPIMGYLCLHEVVSVGKAFGELKWLIGLTFFSYANFVLIGYLKDISADRATGYQTFPVVFGWDPTVWIGDVFVLLSLVFGYQLVSGDFSLLIFSLAGLIAVSGQLAAHFAKQKNESYSKFPIEATVRSFILWHIAVIVASRPEWLIYTIGFYLIFELTLLTRPEKRQI